MQYTLVSADDHLDLNYTPADLWQQRSRQSVLPG